MPFNLGLGPDQRRADAVARLSALHEAGHQYVLISSVLGWLGEPVDAPEAATVPPPAEPPAGLQEALDRLGIQPT